MRNADYLKFEKFVRKGWGILKKALVLLNSEKERFFIEEVYQDINELDKKSL